MMTGTNKNTIIDDMRNNISKEHNNTDSSANIVEGLQAKYWGTEVKENIGVYGMVVYNQKSQGVVSGFLYKCLFK